MVFVLNDIKKTAGANLKKICKMKSIKNTQIADFMGVTAGSVSHWFRGDNFLDIENLYKLCQFLGVSLDQVFGLDPIVCGILNSDEAAFIEAYRRAGSETKENIRRILQIPEVKKDTLSMAE